MIQLVFATNETVEDMMDINYHLGFGNKNSLPWGHCKEDLQFFKAATLGTILVMGANTFRSLPGILPDRPHFVICDPGRPRPVALNKALAHFYIDSLDQAIEYANLHQQTLSVIGGPSLLLEASKVADKIIYTQLSNASPADVYLDVSAISRHFRVKSKKTVFDLAEKHIDHLTIWEKYRK